MGAGKTTVGKLLAKRLGRSFADLDDAVEAAAGKPIARIFAEDGEAAFRAAELAALPGLLDGDGVVAVGGGTPVSDVAWGMIRERALSVWLDAPADVLWSRVEGRAGRPLAAAEDGFRRRLDDRLPRYSEADLRVAAAPGDPESVAAEVATRCAG